MRFKTFLSLALTNALLVPVQAWPQQGAAPKSNLIDTGGGLKIVAIEGEGAINNTRTKTAVAPVVEVKDDQDKPVTGAEVVFQLPAAGPGGVFNGWMRTQTVRTDAQGRAAATGFAPNEEEGRFNIKVIATSGTKTATLVIGQSNSRTGGGTTAAAKRGSSHKTLWILLGLGAAAAITGGIVATHGDDNGSAASSTAVTVTPGAVTVGGPR